MVIGPVSCALIAVIVSRVLAPMVDGDQLSTWTIAGLVLAVLYLAAVGAQAVERLRVAAGVALGAVYPVTGVWLGLTAWLTPDGPAAAAAPYAVLSALLITATATTHVRTPTTYQLSFLILSAATGLTGFLWQQSWTVAVIMAVAGAVTIALGRTSRHNYQELLHLRAESTVRADQATHMAECDALTGVHNRRGLETALADTHDFTTCLFVDLDHFKLINDGHGHDVGDQVLIAVAKRLAGTVGSDGMVARIGGDEFVVLGADGVDGDDLGRRLLAGLRNPVAVAGADPVPVSASIGGCIVGDNDSVSSVLKSADQALYDAKRAGRDQVRWIEAVAPTGTELGRVG